MDTSVKPKGGVLVGETVVKKAPQKPKVTPEQLDKALMNVDELMTTCLIGDSYVLLLDTAKAAHDDIPLYGDGIDVGIEARYITKEVSSLLGMKLRDITEESPNGVTYEFNGIPIRIKYIHRNWKFLKNPKVLTYHYDDYQIPNPFDVYWRKKTRFMVR